MRLINFSPTTVSIRHQQAIEALVSHPIEEVQDIAVPSVLRPPLDEHIAQVVDGAGLTAEEWQTLSLLVIPPPGGFIASCLLTELHGRMGHFPSLVSLEEELLVINLQTLRLQTLRNRHARQRRFDSR